MPWSRRDMVDELHEFAALYEQRPIRDNTGGMRAPHCFAMWFLLRQLQPSHVIESGVFLGQGTFFIESAVPKARIFCLDPNLKRIRHRAKNAEYISQDFATLDWSDLPRERTLVFIDDHQDGYERIKTAHWFGFRHLMFEDNYPASQGNCYSPKKAFMHAGFEMDAQHAKTWKAKLRRTLIEQMKIHVWDTVEPNDVDAKYLRENLAVYYEFPPVIKSATTRWGDPWNDEDYPTPEPLLGSVADESLQVFVDESKQYTWICYIELK